MGRFDNDPAFQERVAELAKDMPLTNARRLAAREFSGWTRPKVERSPIRERHLAAMEAFAKAHKT